MSLGERLKRLRVGKGQSLQQVADAVGASKPHFWELETGRSRNPSLDLLGRIAAHFGTTVAFLIGDDEGVELEAMVFGREFKNLTDDDKKLLLTMAERLNASKDGDGD
jgi:transcriptional regulator with XRE-family HTH domain